MKDVEKTTPARKKSTTLGDVVDRDSRSSSWTSSVLSSFNSNSSTESSSTSKPAKPPEVPSRTRSELLYDVLMRDTIDVDRLAKLSFSGVCSPFLSFPLSVHPSTHNNNRYPTATPYEDDVRIKHVT
jgi:hypothetical protein